MRDRLKFEAWHGLSRFALVGLLGGLTAACTTDSARVSNPFSNPFAASSGSGEPPLTGSIDPAPAIAAPSSVVATRPLPAPTVAAPRPAATPIYNQPTVAAAPRGPAGPAGWTAAGGTAVTVGAGDGLTSISNRYGVPAQAILQANGLASAAQVKPGQRLVIPVYNAVGAQAPSTPRVAEPVRTPAATPRPVVAQVAPQPKTSPAEVKTGAKPSPAVKAAEKPAAAKVAKAEPAKPEPAKVARVEAPSSKKVEVKAAAKPVEAKKPAPEPKVAKAKPVTPEPVKIAKLDTPKKVEAPAKAAEPAKVATAPVKAPEPAKVAAPVKAPEPVKEPVKVAAAQPVPQKAAAQPEAPRPAAPVKEPEATGGIPTNFRWPAKGRVIAGFGANGGNEGINISLPEGTPVKAAEDGVVTYAGSEVKGYGKLVLIKHDSGYVSAYAHNGDIGVRNGEKVKRGQVIAKSGQSGNVTSPQLHFELRKGATPVDPITHLASN